jgi:hypothetical protein
MNKPSTRFLLRLLLCLLAVAWLRSEANDWWDSSTQAHVTARQAFTTEAAMLGCIRKDHIIAAAQARGWNWREMDSFNWCHRAKNPVQNWLRFEIEPPLPFSTDDENAAHWAFDAQGCHIRWEYGDPTDTLPHGNCTD